MSLPLIYIMRINDEAHEGCLKVGKASVKTADTSALPAPNSDILNKAARSRIKDYTQTAGIAYDLLHTEIAVTNSNSTFGDRSVHKVLERSGMEKKDFGLECNPDEWFFTDLGTAKRAIAAVKAARKALLPSEITRNQSPLVLRSEQRAAIEKAKDQFRRNNRMLWNAKMRFGKTTASLTLILEMNLSRTLIITHRPAVVDGWFDDFRKIFYDRQDFAFVSHTLGEAWNILSKSAKNEDKKLVCFASLQDLRGSEKVGGKFEKNDDIFNVDWDLIIIDEAHEGTLTNMGLSVQEQLLKSDTKKLELSGTPFNLLENYKDEEIFTWDYIMEQRAKAEWYKKNPGKDNPYEVLPRMNIFTFDLGQLLGRFQDAELAFNFSEFFKVGDNGEFIHQEDVFSFLNLICQKSEDSRYPYATEENRCNFRHTLWRIPGVKAAKALSTMLQKHPIFGQFQIVNVAGDGDEDVEQETALRMVNKAIGKNPEETYTITLSCGRLTAGISVPAWTAVFMLSGAVNTSASAYMQTIFRCQTPGKINGKIKKECFVFDFAPDRTLKVIAEAVHMSTRAGRTTEANRIAMGDFLNFCPVISLQGTQMTKYNVAQMLEQLKRVYVDRVIRSGFDNIHLYNDNMLKELNIEDCKLFDEVGNIIGGRKKTSNKKSDIEINAQGFDEEKYNSETKSKEPSSLPEFDRKDTDEQKEQKKRQEKALAVLREISIRMPLLLYGVELTDETQELTIDNFADLIDEQSWQEFMPKGVDKAKFRQFVRFYEQDVFCSAGKRIRDLARSADTLPLEERIERIATIFDSLKNPTKETVLTPWRVVNMHMGDSIGGYVFYDEKFETPLSNPRWVENSQVTSNVFKPDSRILEINSKTGLYPLYLTYSLYQIRRKEQGEASSDEMDYVLWDKVVTENIYIICNSPMAKSITKRTLCGFREATINAEYFEDLTNTLKTESQTFVDEVTSQSYWDCSRIGKMKFDAIVGNPPYNLIAKGDASGSDPIYHLFIDASRAICNRGTLIHPGRFLFNAGKTPRDWNNRMLNDEHLKVVHYWANSGDVFPSVSIEGGIAVTYWDNSETYPVIGTFTVCDELQTIIDKVFGFDFASFSSLVYSRTVYRLTDVLYQKNPWAEGRQSKGHKYDVGSNIFRVFPELFTDEKTVGRQVKIYGIEKNKRVYKWTDRRYFSAPDNFNS